MRLRHLRVILYKKFSNIDVSMERLKLVNVLKSTFLGSEFLTFTIRSLKMLLLPEIHRVFFAQLIFMTSSRSSPYLPPKNFSLSK